MAKVIIAPVADFEKSNQPENIMYTSKKDTNNERIIMQIPKKSKIYEYLYVYNEKDTRAKWEQLDAILALAEQTKENFAVRIFDDFVASISIFYPHKRDDLNKLRPLIIKHILNGGHLDESYFKMLQEL